MSIEEKVLKKCHFPRALDRECIEEHDKKLIQETIKECLKKALEIVNRQPYYNVTSAGKEEIPKKLKEVLR